MPNIHEILNNLQDQIDKNEGLADSLTNESILRLNRKLVWHSTITNYAIYFLGIILVFLAGLSYTGYLRLEDKIVQENHYFNQRLDESLHFNTERIDSALKDLREKDESQTVIPHKSEK